jgi:farnesyl diphosphate synthase
LQRIQGEVDGAFDELLPVPDDGRQRLVLAMRHAAIGGGKRVRPLLLVTTAEMYGASRTAALRAGCAIEAIHAYSLVHDDLPCMDDDDMRHGKPTVHRAFDEATAVLAGDALHALAFELLAMPKSAPTRSSAPSWSDARRGERVGRHGRRADDGHGRRRRRGRRAHDHPAAAAQDRRAARRRVEMGAILGKVPDEGRGTCAPMPATSASRSRSPTTCSTTRATRPRRQGAAQGCGKGKATFVSLMGADQARQQAQALSEQAIGHLKGHGEEADILRALARFVVERES